MTEFQKNVDKALLVDIVLSVHDYLSEQYVWNNIKHSNHDSAIVISFKSPKGRVHIIINNHAVTSLDAFPILTIDYAQRMLDEGKIITTIVEMPDDCKNTLSMPNFRGDLVEKFKHRIPTPSPEELLTS